jgi:hypothetical protein
MNDGLQGLDNVLTVRALFHAGLRTGHVASILHPRVGYIQNGFARFEKKTDNM